MDGLGTEAELGPQGGAVFAGGEVLFADPGSLRVRALAPGSGPDDSRVHTLAGSGRSGGADGAGHTATFALPLGLAAAPDGTVYLTDAGLSTVRAIKR